MLEQTAPSANMLMMQNWEVWLIYHSCAVIQRDLDKSEKQVDISSINENGQFQTWGAITLCTSTGLGMTGWKGKKSLVDTRPTASWVSR